MFGITAGKEHQPEIWGVEEKMWDHIIENLRYVRA